MEYPYFTEEHGQLRDTVREFASREIAPHAEAWDEAGIFPRDLFKKAGDLGLLGIRMPEELGGSGLDWWATTAYVEGLAESDNCGVNMALTVQSDMATPIINVLGTDEQKQNFLVPAIQGTAIAALGISEPGIGSDVASLRLKAVREGGDFVISGQKLWITNGSRADFITLAARTGDEGHKGISLFTFPTDVKGYSVGRKLKKVGNLASDTAELYFDQCRIPARYLLGQENRGFTYIMENFQGERLTASILMVTCMDRALRQAVEYGTSRQAFGRPIVSYQVWRHKIAEHLAAVEAGRYLTYRAVDLVNRGKPAVKEITMAKLFVSDLMQRVTYDCMQIHGGFGYTTEYSIGRLWRDARLYTVGAGTSEIMKEIIAKQAGI